MIDLYELRKKLAANGYAQQDVIFCGDETFLYTYNNGLGNKEAIAFFYSNKTKHIRLYRPLNESDMFDQKRSEVSWMPEDIVGVMKEKGLTVNKHQALDMLDSVEKHLKEAALASGWETLPHLLMNLDFEQCQRCAHVIGVMQNEDDDPTGRDSVYQTPGGGAVCGVCKEKFSYKSCDECEGYEPEETLIRVDSVSGTRYICPSCRWDEG